MTERADRNRENLRESVRTADRVARLMGAEFVPHSKSDRAKEGLQKK